MFFSQIMFYIQNRQLNCLKFGVLLYLNYTRLQKNISLIEYLVLIVGPFYGVLKSLTIQGENNEIYER